MSYPVLKMSEVTLSENYFEDKDGYVYSAAKLIEHSKQYEPFDLPLAGIDLRKNAWVINDLDDFIHHANRCAKASLEYPIILDEYGTIADGVHRLCKAIIMGKKTIKAIRLQSMPQYDRKNEKN